MSVIALFFASFSPCDKLLCIYNPSLTTLCISRTFTLRKTNELVGYGLGGSKAPSINRHSGLHLDATDYHKQMEKQDTVIIDVRNKYESDIGHFQPPKGGA